MAVCVVLPTKKPRLALSGQGWTLDPGCWVIVPVVFVSVCRGLDLRNAVLLSYRLFIHLLSSDFRLREGLVSVYPFWAQVVVLFL